MASLRPYRAKRDFGKTPEPKPKRAKRSRKPIFVVQEHHARRLHYDFRLEEDGVLKSWAVPKEPTLDPHTRRLAIHVEDHPLEYAKFHGTIPKGEYGAGEVKIWDHGTYDNVMATKLRPQTVTESIANGHVEVELQGRKLKGRFALIRMAGERWAGKKENWLLFKMRDEYALSDGSESPLRRRLAAPADATQKPPPADVKVASLRPQPFQVTNLDKVWFPDAGITKAEVLYYYGQIAPRLLPFLRDRPATLERLPDGLAGAPHFWQKNTPESYPGWIPRVDIPAANGKPVNYALVNNIETLLYLVNQGTLTFHVWASRVGALDQPDYVLFDLDPGTAGFAEVVIVAGKVHDVLKELGHESFVKTSGKRGLHVLVPWEKGDFDAAREWAGEVADRVVSALPDTATRQIRKAKRGRRVYVDIGQNGRGKHVVPPYVVRPVPEATVSTPLSWREVNEQLDPRRFTLRTILQRLSRQKRDPFGPLIQE
jgi:bifunctional non-homologous end joining protein LigD